MKKIFAVLWVLTVFALSIGLTACGGTDGNVGSTTTTTPGTVSGSGS